MNEHNSKQRYLGEFYTPLNFANKAMHYIYDVIDEKELKSGKYRIWDMACGRGNLEYYLDKDSRVDILLCLEDVKCLFVIENKYGAKEHNPDAEHHNRSRWERDCGGEIFYQQPANRYRRGRKSSEGALDGRKLSLAFRCDISGRWESHIREAGSL